MRLGKIAKGISKNREKRLLTLRCLREKEKTAKGLSRHNQVNVVSWMPNEASVKGRRNLILLTCYDNLDKSNSKEEVGTKEMNKKCLRENRRRTLGNIGSMRNCFKEFCSNC